MTENKRILWNIIATYGRNVFTLLCGFFSGRWGLMALGEVDYGLMGIVGGLMVFIGFFNGVLAGSIGRFYALSVGQAKVAKTVNDGIEECCKWFNTALSIHTFVPIVLLAIGYPIGVWAIENWLTIPPERIQACIWVFRFVCISSFVGMINVPFSGMYTAKQYIAELTVYSFITTTLNVIFLYYMVSHPGVWLAKYALWTCLLSIIPQIIISIRAVLVFPECRIHFRYWYDWHRLLKVGQYAGWQILGGFCGILRTTGISILVNKMFGPRVNTAQAVAQTVNGHATSLAGAMLGAFMPAITNACGAGERQKMHRMAFRACKFGVLLALLFMLPLALELPEIMRLWLKTPPEYAIGLCWCMLVLYLANVITQGHMVVVNANGRIASYQMILSAISVFTIPIAYCCIKWGLGVYLSIGGVMIGGIVLNSIGRILFARYLVGMSIRYWALRIFLPLTLLICICLAVGVLPRLWMEASFWRICVTTGVTEVVLLPCAWLFVLDAEERRFVWAKLLARIFKR